MPRFRPAAPAADEIVPSPAALRSLAAEAFRPAHFFVAPTLRLEWDHGDDEETSWEVFQGRLLDPAHTRQKRSFESWKLYQMTDAGRAAEPVLALLLDHDADELHVVRGLDSYAWEGYDAGGNVYLSREVRKWVRELVGTVTLGQFRTVDAMRDEVICQLFHAVVGASRLPLASVETPLPQFAFGELFYCYRPFAGGDEVPATSWRELVDRMLTAQTTWPECGRVLETLLHATPFAAMADAAGHFVGHWRDLGQTVDDLAALLRTVFNEVSLSPYTDLVAKTLAFVRALEARHDWSAATAADFLSYLLRQNARHLTAYDLVTFHHRGANYPDALLLDAVLKDYLARCDQHPDLFADRAEDADECRAFKRRRRRALRQGYLLRRRYENHPVPDLPTSPGENARVLPPSYPRVPDEQLTQPKCRTKRLFADDPLVNQLTPNVIAVLRQSVADLDHADELRELGMALFLDRPFGIAKAAAEPDATLLLCSEAFSRSVADERLGFLAQPLGLLSPEACDAHRQRWRELEIKGLPLDAVGNPPRPGVIALSDARRATPDFVFLRTTAATLRDLFAQYDFAPLRDRFRLDCLALPRDLLLARAASGSTLILYDGKKQPRVELEVDPRQGFVRRAGCEYPVAGLRVLRIWEDTAGDSLLERDVGAGALVVGHAAC